MKHFILAGLMAATAFTPISTAIAVQPGWDRNDQKDSTDRGDRTKQRDNPRATTTGADRNDRRDNRGDQREVRSDNRNAAPAERHDNPRATMTLGDRNGQRDDRGAQRVERLDNRNDALRERGDNQRNWSEARHDNRNDPRVDRRDNRTDWRGDRRDDHQGRVENRWSDQRRWSNDWRNDRRYDWQNYRQTHRQIFRSGRYYAPRGWDYGYSRFSIGIYLGGPLYSRNYWIDDPWYYRLPPAYGSLRWIRYYDDAMLIDIRDGYVVDVIYDFFD